MDHGKVMLVFRREFVGNLDGIGHQLQIFNLTRPVQKRPMPSITQTGQLPPSGPLGHQASCSKVINRLVSSASSSASRKRPGNAWPVRGSVEISIFESLM